MSALHRYIVVIFQSLVLVLATFMLSGCTAIFGDKMHLIKTDFSEIKYWPKTDNLTINYSDFNTADKDYLDLVNIKYSNALAAFQKSCDKFIKIDPNKIMQVQDLEIKYSKWHEVCNKMPADIATSPEDVERQAANYFNQNFTPYLVKNWLSKTGLFTGYYESSLHGSRVKKFPYIYPVYKAPKDLSKKKPYFSREEIIAGALDNQNLEILWVDDKIELFFMEIQGSGRVILDNGSEVKLNYAGQNGHKYYAIGRYFVKNKFLDKNNVSKATIKQWLVENPLQADAILNQNPSYVFFRENKDAGPVGASGVALTPYNSLAVDKNYIKYGIPIYLETKLNYDATRKNKLIFRQVVVAQDTGGAIKGPVRGDIFLGYGGLAEKLAGFQNHRGWYYLLLPK